MELIAMEKEQFQEMCEDIKAIKQALNSQRNIPLSKKWLTTNDVVSLFGISRRTVYYWVSRNILTAHKVSGTQLFDYEQIEELLKK